MQSSLHGSVSLAAAVSKAWQAVSSRRRLDNPWSHQTQLKAIFHLLSLRPLYRCPLPVLRRQLLLVTRRSLALRATVCTLPSFRMATVAGPLHGACRVLRAIAPGPKPRAVSL